MLSYLVMGSVFAFAAAVQPGPLQAYLISRSFALGWRRTILAACAPLLSDGPIIVAELIILNVMLVGLLHLLQCIGSFHQGRTRKRSNKTTQYPCLSSITLELSSNTSHL